MYYQQNYHLINVSYFSYYILFKISKCLVLSKVQKSVKLCPHQPGTNMFSSRLILWVLWVWSKRPSVSEFRCSDKKTIENICDNNLSCVGGKLLGRKNKVLLD